MAMISKETVSIGILAIASGLVAAYAIRAQLSKEHPVAQARPAKPKVETLKVPIAATDLPAGRVIKQGDVAVLPMTFQAIQKREPRTELVMMRASDIGGRRIREPIKQGDLFLTTGLYSVGTGIGVAERLKPGFRAVSVYVAEGHLTGVEPGAFADLLFRTLPRPGNRWVAPIAEMTVTFMSHVEVLDIEGEPRPGNAQPVPTSGMVTLAIPVEQVNRLRAVEGRGEFSLIPRALDEPILLTSASTGSDAMTLEDALGIEMPPPATPPFQTVIYRRGVAHVNSFVDGQPVELQPTGAAEPTSAAEALANAHAASPQATPTAGSRSPRSSGGATSQAKSCPTCKNGKGGVKVQTPTPAR
jgi:Flp pilus assembly protein CpaB